MELPAFGIYWPIAFWADVRQTIKFSTNQKIRKKLLFDFTRFLHVCFTPSIYIFVGSETLFKDSCTSILKDLACVSCFAKFSFHSLSQSNNFCCSWNTWVLSFAVSSSYSFKLLCKWVIVWSCSYDEVKRRCVQLSCNNSQILSFSPFLAFNKLPRPDNSAAEEGRSGWGRVPRSLRPFSAPFKQLNKYNTLAMIRREASMPRGRRVKELIV